MNPASPAATSSAPPALKNPQSTGDTADPAHVLADRVDQLYSQLPLAIVAPFVVAAIASIELWDQRLKELVLFWWFTVLVVTAANATLLVAYRKSADKLARAAQWLRWRGIAALASGVNWGFAGAVFFPSHVDEEQVFLAFLLSGMASFGIPIYAASWPIFALYGGAILLPFTYVLANFGNKLFTEIAVMVPIYYLINVAIGYRLSEVFQSGYRLRHAYGRLTQDYTALNVRLERQLADLAQAHREVEASGRKLALFAERSPIGVFEFDPRGTVLSINPAAEQLFGYVASEVVGQSGTGLLFPHDQQQDSAEQWRRFVAERSPLFGLRYNNQRRDGVEVVCEWSLTPLVNPEGEVISVIVQGRDITQQLEAERLKKEFTSTLSHELRTPLTSIIGSLQLVNTGVMGEIDKDVLELTAVAERNAQRLLDLINDILDIEKIESGKLELHPEILPLHDLVRESLVLNKGYAERFGVHFDLRGEPVQVPVRADLKRLLQVLTNLLSNAAKFSPEGGTIEVTTARLGPKVRVGVHDRGPGIPENFRKRIFGRFAQADSTFTRQKGGTGLGLSICKRLVELMNGQIGFEDREGGGTTFYFELPVVEAESAAAPTLH